MKKINKISIYILAVFTMMTLATSCNRSEDAATKGEITINFDEKNVPDDANGMVNEDDENVILKAGGIYLLKGTLKNKRVKVEKDQGERTEITLDGFNFVGDKDCVIYSPEKENKVLLFLADGSENNITLDASKYQSDVVNEKAAIFTSGDLSFNGKGKLTIDTELESCIECIGDLAFIEGQYTLNSKGDAVRSKEKLLMKDGSFNITSGDDAIKVTSESKAYFHFENANLYIMSNDKGVSSDNEVHIEGGNISIDAKGEGIAGKVVEIKGGVVKIKSQDDGINANDNKQNKKDNQEGVYVNILGGSIDIDAAMDGIDSNGDLSIEGGELFISGADNDNERIIDYNGNINLGNAPGVHMIGVGPGAKMQDFGDNAKQNYIVMYFKDAVESMHLIDVSDELGNRVISQVPNRSKSYRAALITTSKLEAGKTYTITVISEPNGKERKIEKTIDLVVGRNVIDLR